MHSLLNLALVLRLGTFVSAPSPAAPVLSVRDELQAIAAESAQQAMREDEGRQEREEWTGPLALQGDWTRQDAGAFPVHYRYRPSEWISIMAARLHVERTFVVRTALWFASWPVAVQATDNRVYARVTLAIP